MSTSRTQQVRTSVDNSPPSDLLPGQLAVEMGTPTRLWVGVPASSDPARKKLLINADEAAQIAIDLADKAPLVHTHQIADVAGLRAELDLLQGGPAVPPHAHQIVDVLGLQTALDGKSPANHSHDFSQITGTLPPPSAHKHDIADITGFGGLATIDIVGAAQIKDGSIGSSKIAEAAVITEKIADNAVDGQKIALGGDTNGDIMVYNGSNWTRLPGGVSGQILQTFGTEKPPQWVNPPSTLNNVQIAARVPVFGAGISTIDASIVNGPYSAYRVSYKLSASTPNSTAKYSIQVFDGAAWGGEIVFDSLVIASTSKTSSGEFWIFNCAMDNTLKSFIKEDGNEVNDSVATGVTTALRFTKAGGSMSAIVTGFK